MDKFEKQHLAAVKHAEERLVLSPRAKRVSFDRKTRRLVVDLENGTTFIVPVSLVQILADATDDQIAAVSTKVEGLYLTWEELDEDLTLEHLMSGTFGTQKWMHGVLSTSTSEKRKAGSAKLSSKTA